MILSIITINFNNAEGLRKTIESVISQTFTDFEYIVIDGASTDGSVDVIKQYADKITYWVSEPDKGIYNAMNKGIVKSIGSYCLFLNSGDWLVDEFVLDDFCNARFTEDVVSGNIFFIENSKYILHQSPHYESLSLKTFYGGSLPHQASFIKRSLFDKYGTYNESNRIVSDKEFFVKVLIENNCSYSHFNRIIANFEIGGISSQKEWDKIHEIEGEEALLKYINPLVYRGFKQVVEENKVLYSHEMKYREYMNLLNGKCSFIIKTVLWIKNLKKSIRV